MAQIEIRLPKMGESVTEATITNWLKNIGDTIEMDEPLVEVATDKVDNELPSEAEGVLVKQLFDTDEVAQVGDVIAIISTDGDAPTNDASAPTAKADVVSNVAAAEIIAEVETVAASVNGSGTMDKNGPTGKFYSPLVRSISEKEGISMTELESISGSGQGGRVTKKDIMAFISGDRKAATPAPAASNSAAPKPTKVIAAAPTGGGFLSNIKEPIVIAGPDDEIIEMDRMRKLIADHMVMSTHVSPHVTSYVEADVTNIWNWRKKVKSSFMEKEGENITFTPIFMEAIVKAIKDFPMVNVSISGTQIIKRKHINIGMATALPSGNLIVPVIKDADRMNLTGLTKSVNEMANKARNNKLSSDDIQGGTYTVTNVGTFGNVMGTPIINQPQVAILALGAIRKVPAVIETPDGDFIGIRHKMFLSHSYDHRVVDGALGGMFVKRVADYLEQFDASREI
ncbi:MAG: 2-oxoglutarate dehydrogenase E2 component (dihydrolipoamide succinyltransferase) [Crocinitomicaceae bacterium]|jgi:2-oxoglutarate dehydrogenase E2 component (dihydrolipoamide succinyltransferase)